MAKHQDRPLTKMLSSWYLMVLALVMVLLFPTTVFATSVQVAHVRVAAALPPSAAVVAAAAEGAATNNAQTAAGGLVAGGGSLRVNMTSAGSIPHHGHVDLALPLGRHRVTLDHPQYVFPDLLLTVTANRIGAPYLSSAALAAPDRSNKYKGKQATVSKAGVVEWEATAPRQYFEVRPGFNPLAMLGNPMLLMGLMSTGMVVLMPKLQAMLLDDKKDDVKEDTQSGLAKYFKSL